MNKIKVLLNSQESHSDFSRADIKNRINKSKADGTWKDAATFMGVAPKSEASINKMASRLRTGEPKKKPMSRNTKIGIGVGTGVALAAGAGLAVKHSVDQKKKEEDMRASANNRPRQFSDFSHAQDVLDKFAEHDKRKESRKKLKVQKANVKAGVPTKISTGAKVAIGIGAGAAVGLGAMAIKDNHDKKKELEKLKASQAPQLQYQPRQFSESRPIMSTESSDFGLISSPYRAAKRTAVRTGEAIKYNGVRKLIAKGNVNSLKKDRDWKESRPERYPAYSKEEKAKTDNLVNISKGVSPSSSSSSPAKDVVKGSKGLVDKLKNSSTKTKVGIGVGTAAAIGVGAYAIKKNNDKKKEIEQLKAQNQSQSRALQPRQFSEADPSFVNSKGFINLSGDYSEGGDFEVFKSDEDKKREASYTKAGNDSVTERQAKVDAQTKFDNMPIVNNPEKPKRKTRGPNKPKVPKEAPTAPEPPKKDNISPSTEGTPIEKSTSLKEKGSSLINKGKVAFDTLKNSSTSSKVGVGAAAAVGGLAVGAAVSHHNQVKKDEEAARNGQPAPSHTGSSIARGVATTAAVAGAGALGYNMLKAGSAKKGLTKTGGQLTGLASKLKGKLSSGDHSELPAPNSKEQSDALTAILDKEYPVDLSAPSDAKLAQRHLSQSLGYYKSGNYKKAQTSFDKGKSYATPLMGKYANTAKYLGEAAGMIGTDGGLTESGKAVGGLALDKARKYTGAIGSPQNKKFLATAALTAVAGTGAVIGGRAALGSYGAKTPTKHKLGGNSKFKAIKSSRKIAEKNYKDSTRPVGAAWTTAGKASRADRKTSITKAGNIAAGKQKVKNLFDFAEVPVSQAKYNSVLEKNYVVPDQVEAKFQEAVGTFGGYSGEFSTKPKDSYVDHLNYLSPDPE